MQRIFTGLVAAVALLAWCTAASFAGGAEETGAQPAADAGAAMQSGKYNEAPMLAALVAAGSLPPVEERLPPDPPVITPLEEIGQYGGTLRMAINSPYGFAGDGQSAIGPETILRISPEYNAVLPGIAESWEYQNEGRTLMLSLVPGINWSSGEPFTADDILFWYEKVLLDDELTPSKPVYWMPGGELMTLSKVDPYTIRMDFAEPYPIATMLLAHYRGFPAAFYHPDHYLRDFHPSVVDKANLEARAKEAGFDAWHQLFKAQYRSGYVPTVVGYPVINPYVITSISGDVRIFERNPYYWKIDPANNQLPYIDSVVANYIGDAEVANLKMIQGELDYAARQMTMQNYPLYLENQESGNYRVLLWKRTSANELNLQFNQTIGDPVLREIFQDVRFRIAMSLALDREEFNKILYFGRATPRQVTAVKESSYYVPEYETRYIEYDPAEADRLLDEMGLTDRDADGYRLRPDGKRLAFTIEFSNSNTGEKTSGLELIVEQWREVGVDAALKAISNELVQARTLANQMEVGVWDGSNGMDISFITDPRWWVPYTTGWERNWAVEWARWIQSGGAEGEEPPEIMKQLVEWWNQMKTTTDLEERIRLGKLILEVNADNLWTIGTVGEGPLPILVNKDLRNIPETGLHGFDAIRLQPNHPETFFFKR